MLDTEVRNINEVLRMTKTGLVDDCINIWTPMNSAIALSELLPVRESSVATEQTQVHKKIQQLLRVQLPLYFEYFSTIKAGDIEAIRTHKKHDPVQVERFDALVDEYNGLVVQGSVSLTVAKQFQKRKLAIVRGN